MPGMKNGPPGIDMLFLTSRRKVCASKVFEYSLVYLSSICAPASAHRPGVVCTFAFFDDNSVSTMVALWYVLQVQAATFYLLTLCFMRPSVAGAVRVAQMPGKSGTVRSVAFWWPYTKVDITDVVTICSSPPPARGFSNQAACNVASEKTHH